MVQYLLWRIKSMASLYQSERLHITVRIPREEEGLFENYGCDSEPRIEQVVSAIRNILRLEHMLTCFPFVLVGVYYNQVKSSFERICEKTGSHSHTYYHTHIEQVKRFLHIDREARRFENSQPLLSDAPIARAFGPDDADTSSAKIWYDYTVSVQPDPHYPRELLHIRAKVDYVLSVTWRKPGEQAEVVLVDTPTRFFVAPLKPVSEAQQEDEICVQDLVLLVGRYLVIATLQQNDFNNPCVMTNWLEIQEAHTEEGRRRGRNFAAKSEHPVMRFV